MKPIPHKTQNVQTTEDFSILQSTSAPPESLSQFRMEKLGILELLGHSGQSYTFHTYSLKQPLRVIATVYMVCRTHTPAQGRTECDKLFIGSTDNLAVAFNPHNQQAAFARHGANVICIYPISNAQNRKTIEQDLIAKYHPPCNR